MIEISHAEPHEREEVARFMELSFPRAKWGAPEWQNLLAGRWSPEGGSFAIVARDRGKLVGVLGLVTAKRPGGGVTANMTSWYLDKTCRGQSIGRKMVELAAADPEITVTNFTSAPGALHAVRAAGLKVLDSERLVWRASGDADRLPVHRDLAGVQRYLNARDQQVLADHVGLNLTPVVVQTPDGLCLIILSIKQKTEDRVMYEVFYCGDRSRLEHYARPIANSLLPAKAAVLSVDRRLLPAGTKADAVEPFAVPRFYTPGRMAPEEIDLLYSEAVILGLKLY